MSTREDGSVRIEYPFPLVNENCIATVVNNNNNSKKNSSSGDS